MPELYVQFTFCFSMRSFGIASGTIYLKIAASVHLTFF